MIRYCTVVGLLLGMLCCSSANASTSARDDALYQVCQNTVPEYIELFKSIINIDSGSKDIKGLNQKKDFLVDYLKKAGAEVQVVEAAGDRKGTYNIILEFMEKERQGFCCAAIMIPYGLPEKRRRVLSAWKMEKCLVRGQGTPKAVSLAALRSSAC